MLKRTSSNPIIGSPLREMWLDKVTGMVSMSASARGLAIMWIEDWRYLNGVLGGKTLKKNLSQTAILRRPNHPPLSSAAAGLSHRTCPAAGDHRRTPTGLERTALLAVQSCHLNQIGDGPIIIPLLFQPSHSAMILSNALPIITYVIPKTVPARLSGSALIQLAPFSSCS